MPLTRFEGANFNKRHISINELNQIKFALAMARKEPRFFS